MTFLDKEWDEKGDIFIKKYGIVAYDRCYGGLSYSRNADKKVYAMKYSRPNSSETCFLTLEEITELMNKTLETGVDHLYEVVKDHPVPPLPPGCLS